MNERHPEHAIPWLKHALAAHTLVFAICAYFAIVETGGAALRAFDWEMCRPGSWPCTSFDSGWPIVVVLTVVAVVLQTAAIFLHVRSQLHARRPGSGRASVLYAVAALLVLVAVFVLGTTATSGLQGVGAP